MTLSIFTQCIEQGKKAAEAALRLAPTQHKKAWPVDPPEHVSGASSLDVTRQEMSPSRGNTGGTPLSFSTLSEPAPSNCSRASCGGCLQDAAKLWKGLSNKALGQASSEPYAPRGQFANQWEMGRARESSTAMPSRPYSLTASAARHSACAKRASLCSY